METKSRFHCCKIQISVTQRSTEAREKGIRVLDRMAMGLRTYTERTGDGSGLPAFDVNQGEVLMHVLPVVGIVFDNRPPEFPGTLYVSSRYLLSFRLFASFCSILSVLEFHPLIPVVM